ncbi:MAG: radical SAM family heme chaperone HemW [Muribaculaceae bacterium]|nr:radical SAM family heme chaperone HemW [Muribaculaceae bacterium]
MVEGGIYVHIPFCRNKCLYCDFYTGGVRIADWEKYRIAILNELESRINETVFLPSTLYFGGGTPSIIPNEFLKRIVTGITTRLGVKDWNEFTIEVNPEDVNEEKCKVWKESGVNRVSLGVQTLNDGELKLIGRRHTAQDSIEAISLLRRYFDNISVDLMFGIPGQTLDTYEKSLDKIIELKPHHISSYSLMLEPGTAMTLLVEKEKLLLPNEDVWMKMFQTTLEKLNNAGFVRYEISNYALPGYESQHNSGYWLGKPYLGLGSGAHSYDGDSIRRANPNDIKGYVVNFNQEHNKFYKEEILTDEELKEEMIMTRLRMSQGLDLEEFESKFGEWEKIELLNRASSFFNKGLMKIHQTKLSFTPAGFEVSDLLLSSLI